jgi:hypothetical protein
LKLAALDGAWLGGVCFAKASEVLIYPVHKQSKTALLVIYDNTRVLIVLFNKKISLKLICLFCFKVLPTLD